MTAARSTILVAVIVELRRFQIVVAQDGPAAWRATISERTGGPYNTQELGLVETTKGLGVALHLAFAYTLSIGADALAAPRRASLSGQWGARLPSVVMPDAHAGGERTESGLFSCPTLGPRALGWTYGMMLARFKGETGGSDRAAGVGEGCPPDQSAQEHACGTQGRPVDGQAPGGTP